MKKHIFLTYMLLNVVFLVQGQDDFSSSVIAHNNIKIAESYITELEGSMDSFLIIKKYFNT